VNFVPCGKITPISSSKTLCTGGNHPHYTSHFVRGPRAMSFHISLGVDMIAYKCNFIHHINPERSKIGGPPAEVVASDEYYYKQILGLHALFAYLTYFAQG